MQPSVTGVTVSCPSQLLVGQSLFCNATASLTGGGIELINAAGVDWFSSNPNIASTGPLGVVKGRSSGHVTISTVYGGVTGAADVAVSHQDVLQCSNAVAHQGDFRTGMTVTMWLQGFYGVESATSGQLTAQITDQDGAVVATGAPQTVARGGDSFVISSTFTIPTGATRVCRTALLQIGSQSLSCVPPPQDFRCMTITP